MSEQKAEALARRIVACHGAGWLSQTDYDEPTALRAALPYAAALVGLAEALQQYVACQDRIMQPWENYDAGMAALAAYSALEPK